LEVGGALRFRLEAEDRGRGRFIRELENWGIRELENSSKRSKVRDQRTENRGQRRDVGGWRGASLEVGGRRQRADFRLQIADCGFLKRERRVQKNCPILAEGHSQERGNLWRDTLQTTGWR